MGPDRQNANRAATARARELGEAHSMSHNRPSTLPLAAAVALQACAATACGARHQRESPSIEFTGVPAAAVGGPRRLAPISGRVKGARANQQVVLFAHAGAWWVQPFRSRPFTHIQADSTWKSEIHLGAEYAALLVEPDYHPPVTVDALPAIGGGVVAVAKVKGTGGFVEPASKTIAFSGYDWVVRQVMNERFGRNEYDARNVWVDAKGHLHLLLTQRNGQWTSAEVVLTRHLGYGTYVFQVRDVSQMDPASAFSMYTWDEFGADQNYREMNIDMSRWGDPHARNARYVLDPDHVATNVFRFDAPPGTLTHSLKWEPGRVSFATMRANDTGAHAPPAAQWQMTAGVPTAGTESIHLTLLYVRSSPSPPSGNVEVVVERFLYLP
jgi:hypothetical protein